MHSQSIILTLVFIVSESCTWIPEKLQLVQQPSCVGAGWISQPINYIRI